MLKREFYLKALQAQTYLVTAWNIACYSLVAESPEEWKKNPYPYRLVQLPNAHYFVNPENTQELVLLEDSKGGTPLFKRNELIVLQPQELQNVYEEVVTTYGNVLVNQLLLVRPFGGKIAFMKGRISTKKIERIIEERLVEGEPDQGPKAPETGSNGFSDPPLQVVDFKGEVIERNSSSPQIHTSAGSAAHNTSTSPVKAATSAPIYVSEYLRYAGGAFSLVAYTQIFTPADTYKTMTAPPGLKELKAKLLKQYAGRLHDRAVVAEINEQLMALDAEYLKGDRGGEDFLTSGKSKRIVRPRLFLMYGAETGIEEKVDVDLIENSLTEGWDIAKFPEMNNALRAGSFNRGKMTELGGEAVKDLFRASGNLKISSPDCGSTVGLPSFFKKEDADRIVGFSAMAEDGSVNKITKDNVGDYLGKHIRLRSPMTCKMSHTDYCQVCLGDRLANNPTSLSMAVADYGSTMMLIYMSAAHSKGIQLARLNIADQLQ